MFQFTSTNKKA